MHNFEPFYQGKDDYYNPYFTQDNNWPNENDYYFNNNDDRIVKTKIITPGKKPKFFPPFQPYPPFPPYPPYQPYPPRPNARQRARQLRKCVNSCERYYYQNYPKRYIRCINNCCQSPYYSSYDDQY